MKVCIIGAGIAGLSCALTLQQQGIKPDIYEQLDRCGGRVPFIVCLLQIMHRPIPDPLKNLTENYGISITPVAPLTKIIRFSPHEMSKTKGELGYIFEMGPGGRSITSQLYEQLASSIKFNIVASPKNLLPYYDKVVVATGSPYVAKELGLWTDVFRCWVRGAVVEGDFEPNTWIIWFNKTYAKNGYAYLGPFNSRKASLVLIVSDVRKNELENRWRMFLKVENIGFRERETFILEHITGICQPKETGKIIFVGNSAGLMESVFGFGVYQAVVSGVAAARAIVENTSYTENISSLEPKLRQGIQLRRRLNAWNNKNYDQLMEVFNIPPLNHLIYKTNLDVLKYHSFFTELAGKRI